jgi:hypothetical protein
VRSTLGRWIAEELPRDVGQVELIAASFKDAAGFRGVLKLPPAFDVGPIEDPTIMLCDAHDALARARLHRDSAWLDQELLKKATVCRVQSIQLRPQMAYYPRDGSGFPSQLASIHAA